MDAEGEADDGEKEEEQEKKEEEREHAANADDHFDDGDYEIPKTILTEKEHVSLRIILQIMQWIVGLFKITGLKAFKIEPKVS